MATTNLSSLRESDAAALSIAQVAAVLGVDVRTVSTGIKDGVIPSVRLGRRVLIPREKFLAMWTADPGGDQ